MAMMMTCFPLLVWIIVLIGLECSTCFVPISRPVHRFASHADDKTKQHEEGPSLSILAMMMGGNPKSNDAKSKEEALKMNDDEDDDDFSRWVSSSLRQWPLVPPSSPPTTSSFEEQEDEEQQVLGLLTKNGQGTANDDPPPKVVDEPNMITSSQKEVKSMPTVREQRESSFWQIWNLQALLDLTAATVKLGDASSTAPPLDSNNKTAAMARPLAPDWKMLEDLVDWNNFFRWNGPSAVADTANNNNNNNNTTKGSSSNQALVESWIRQATTRLESIVADASAVLSPEAIERLISTRAAAELLETAKRIALDRGMNVSIAARESANFARSFFQAADASIEQGRLFENFETVVQCSDTAGLVEAGKMGALAGAVYEDTVPRTFLLGESIVTRGTTKDVVWMVTDGLGQDGGLVRTITIRGYDASDQDVDREQLLNNICTALPERLKSPRKTINVHSGMLQLAREMYDDVKPYINWTSPNHKLILNGHSVGGSLALLMLFLMVNDFGIDFTKKRVQRVYTFGSPPVVADPKALERFDIPVDLVHGYIQPWDPIVRLFSSIDALYPLVSDLGADGSTPFADGPPRTLRPLTKAIIESWEGWPRFRNNFRGTGDQTYYSVGVQHILLPEPTRYLADRFAAVNIPVPPVESIVRLSSEELQPVLSTIFPLDVFEISFVPQAIRSFVHHFYPAYWYPLADYVKTMKLQQYRDEAVAQSTDRVPSASKWFAIPPQGLISSTKRP